MSEQTELMVMEGETDPARRPAPRTSRLEARIENDDAAKGRAARRDMRNDEEPSPGSIRC